MSSAPRVLIAKVGLDGHDRALRMLAMELRDRGAEVVMLGVGSTPEQIAAAAVDEDVTAVGLSIHSGAHMTLVPRVLECLKAEGSDAPVVCGGVIAPADYQGLSDAGVAGVAPVGTTISGAADLIIQGSEREA